MQVEFLTSAIIAVEYGNEKSKNKYRCNGKRIRNTLHSFMLDDIVAW
jgi:hypothetical protein